jgi:hypothetical protein
MTGFTFPVNLLPGAPNLVNFSVDDGDGNIPINFAFFAAPDAVQLNLDRTVTALPVTLSYDGLDPAMVSDPGGIPVCAVVGLVAGLSGPAPLMLEAHILGGVGGPCEVTFDRPMDQTTGLTGGGFTWVSSGIEYAASSGAWASGLVLVLTDGIIGVGAGETVTYPGGGGVASLMGTLLMAGSVPIT